MLLWNKYIVSCNQPITQIPLGSQQMSLIAVQNKKIALFSSYIFNSKKKQEEKIESLRKNRTNKR